MAGEAGLVEDMNARTASQTTPNPTGQWGRMSILRRIAAHTNWDIYLFRH